MLTAMESGGRIGNDAPYMPRDCDMRWFTTDEVCEILSRFEKIIFVGDSMMRHVIGAINVILRENLGYGAVTDWNFSEEERYVLLTFRLGIYLLIWTLDVNASAICNSMSRLAPYKEYSKLKMSSRMIQAAYNGVQPEISTF